MKGHAFRNFCGRLLLKTDRRFVQFGSLANLVKSGYITVGCNNFYCFVLHACTVFFEVLASRQLNYTGRQAKNSSESEGGYICLMFFTVLKCIRNALERPSTQVGVTSALQYIKKPLCRYLHVLVLASAFTRRVEPASPTALTTSRQAYLSSEKTLQSPAGEAGIRVIISFFDLFMIIY